MFLLLILPNIWNLWNNIYYVNILDTPSLEANPFVCIDTIWAKEDLQKETLHRYYAYTKLQESSLANQQFKQWRIPNHWFVFFGDDQKDGLIAKNYVEKWFCQDTPSFSWFFSFREFKIPLLASMALDQPLDYKRIDEYSYSVSWSGSHFIVPAYRIPEGAKLFSFLLNWKKYFFYLYFWMKERTDSALLSSSFAYINYPTQFKDILSHSDEHFFSLYNKKQGRLFIYKVFGVQNDDGSFSELTRLDQVDSDDSILWNYFQLLPLYIQLSKTLI